MVEKIQIFSAILFIALYISTKINVVSNYLGAWLVIGGLIVSLLTLVVATLIRAWG